MLDLLDQAGTFLQPQHYRSDPAGYTRNLIYDAADDSLSRGRAQVCPAFAGSRRRREHRPRARRHRLASPRFPKPYLRIVKQPR
jgi:hypothetical protein